jgi:DNA-binding beta-propeller fold protein YncE
VRAEIEASRNASVNTLVPTARDPRKKAIRLLFKISGYGKEPGKFDFPTHATFMPNGDLLVADKNNFRLQIFDTNGQLKKELFSGIIKPRRARMNPSDGNIYVSDEDSETVKIFNGEGKLVARAGEHYFMCAAGLDFDSKGNLVMVDPEKNQVSAHDMDSHKILTNFLFRYLIDRRIPHPYYVCVNEDDQYIVSDTRNNRVKVFSSTGRLLLHIDKLDCPRGVAVDPYGNILVAEGDRHCVTMYNPYGKFLQYVIDRGDFGLCYPLSLDMDKKGRLAVTQCGYTSPHEVLVFQLG